MNISTSNHIDMGRFYCSAKNTLPLIPTDSKEIAIKYGDKTTLLIPYAGKTISYTIDIATAAACMEYLGGKLNTEPNNAGFETRRQNGSLAAKNLLKDIADKKSCCEEIPITAY